MDVMIAVMEDPFGPLFGRLKMDLRVGMMFDALFKTAANDV